MKMKIYISILIFSFATCFLHLSIKKEKLESEIESLFRYLSDSIYRYQISVINTNQIEINKKSHIYDGDLLFMNNKNYGNDVKLLADNIQELIRDSRENSIIDDNLWTVANIFPTYMYIYPDRNGYKELINSHKDNSYFDYLVRSEKIDFHLVRDDLSVYETIRVFGPYYEDITGEKLITIYYPLYNNKVVESILLLDVKYDFLHEYISKYNYRNISALKLSSNGKEADLIFKIIAKQNNQDNVYLPIMIDYFLFIVLYFFVTLFYFSVYFSYVLFVENKKDNLTGFYRKDFLKKIKQTNCVIVIDIDFFKKINDTYGHAVGDLVIGEVSKRIRNSIRKTDVAIRWGGEEFVVLFDNLFNIDNLTIKLDELLNIVSNEKIENLDVTISIGAFISLKKLNLSDAFIYADKALYKSKSTGRNKYTICHSLDK